MNPVDTAITRVDMDTDMEDTDMVMEDTDMVMEGMDKADMAMNPVDTAITRVDMDTDMAMKTADTVIPMDTLQAITDHPRATPTLRIGKEVTKDMPKLKANLARNNLLRSTVIRELCNFTQKLLIAINLSP